MADHSAISWTDATWPITAGCDHVSPGCDTCYAATLTSTRLRHLLEYEGLAVAGRFTGEVRVLPKRLDWPLRWRKPRRVFVCSMSDLFYEKVPDDFIVRAFAVMALTARHTFQVLTKRHGRLRSLLTRPDFRREVGEEATEIIGRTGPWQRRGLDLGGQSLAGDSGYGPQWTVERHGKDNLWLPPWPLPNVHIGVSAEDQKWADIRIPALLETPAAVRWISAEPLLGPIWLTDDWLAGLPHRRTWLDWVVAGGETSQHGRVARPSHTDWFRQIRDSCNSFGVPFHFKQFGDWASPEQIDSAGYDDVEMGDNGLTIWPDGRVWAGRHGTAIDGSEVLWRVGKKRAGRRLDGKLWDEYPVVS